MDDELLPCPFCDYRRERSKLRAENERLTAELTAERERNRWISVGERLPGKDKKAVFAIRLCNGEYIYKVSEYQNLIIGHIINITHWRPIVPPESEEK